MHAPQGIEVSESHVAPAVVTEREQLDHHTDVAVSEGQIGHQHLRERRRCETGRGSERGSERQGVREREGVRQGVW